jgi:hypothetical protein
MLVFLILVADFSRGCAHPAMQQPISATHSALRFVLTPSSHLEVPQSPTETCSMAFGKKNPFFQTLL